MFRLSTVGSRTFNVSERRIWNGLPKTLFRRWHFQVSGAVLNPSSYSYPDIVFWLYISHYSGPCSDVHHLGHSKITELNWSKRYTLYHARRTDLHAPHAARVLARDMLAQLSSSMTSLGLLSYNHNSLCRCYFYIWHYCCRLLLALLPVRYVVNLTLQTIVRRFSYYSITD